LRTWQADAGLELWFVDECGVEGDPRPRRRWVARLHRDTMLVQEWIPGQEYGLDIVNDLTSRYVGTLARRKLVMRAGNTDRAVTVHRPMLIRLGESIGQRLAHLGDLDCDLDRKQ
jgi:hypothetical protein